MRIRVVAHLALGLALGCGGTQAETAGPPTTTTNETHQTPETRPSPLVGHWHGEMAGGPISAVADYHFELDGTYAMDGYPSIAERGHSAVDQSGDVLTLHLTARTRCGPCEAAGPIDAADDSVETATLSGEGSSLSWRGWTFARNTP